MVYVANSSAGLKMSNSTISRPLVWDKIMLFVAIGKSAVVGATVGLAVLGAMDIALAASASAYLQNFQDQYIDTFAIAGGSIGIIGKIIALILR